MVCMQVIYVIVCEFCPYVKVYSLPYISDIKQILVK